MGFLQRFFRNVFRDETYTFKTNCFEKIASDDLESHLEVRQYGDFILTDAIRPSYDLKVVPEQGYRYDHYVDPGCRTSVPVLIASVSEPILFDTFLDLLAPLGSVVDIVLETSHKKSRTEHEDLYREHIDTPVLTSYLYNYEEMLMNDGCAGIAVLNPSIPVEIQFDEHKLLIVYGKYLQPFERILRHRGIQPKSDLRFITDAEHVHSSKVRYIEQFMSLQTVLGLDADYDD